MKKKISIEKKQKIEIKKLNEHLREVMADKSRYQSILNQIENIIQSNTSYNGASLSFTNLPTEVLKLQLYKRQHEGATHSYYDVVQSQREIIRWLIKPSTAEKPKEEIINDFMRKDLM